MQVNKDPAPLPTSLFCDFLNEKQNSYFQLRKLPFPTPDPFTVRDLKTDLKSKKIETISTKWTSYIDRKEVLTATIYLNVAVCSLLLLETFSRLMSPAYDPVPREPFFSYFKILLKEGMDHDYLFYRVPAKHFGKSDVPTSGSRILITFIECTLLIPTIYHLSKLFIKPIHLSKKTTELNKKINLDNENIDKVLEGLSFQGDEMSEVNPKDTAKAFPYLSDEVFKKLKFNQLQKAYKKNPEIFVEKLKKSLFSNEQLAIWRLFHRFQKADSKEKEDILSAPLCQELIASRVAFFELTIRSIEYISKHKMVILTEILKEKILIKELGDQFEAKNLKEIIKQVCCGKSLRKAIELKLYGIRKFASISSEEEKDLCRFYRFTESGKLKLEEPLEILKFIKMAKETDKGEVFNWLSFYLKSFLNTEKNSDWSDQLINILDWAKNEDLENVRLMIDVLLEKWLAEHFGEMTEEGAKKIGFSKIRNLLRLAKEKNLYIYTRSLKQLYGRCIDLLELNEECSITEYLNDFEEIFGHNAAVYRELLKEKIRKYLIEGPERIETLAIQAEQDQNKWLKEVIMGVFVENEELFLPYWLTPYEVV